MSSYSQIIEDLDAVFATSEWTSNDIASYPSNMAPTGTKPSEYVVLEVLPSQDLSIQYGSVNQVSGLIIIQIYTPVNTGPRRIYEISDLLDNVLQKQQLGEGLQTNASALDPKGNDPDDPTLYRADYVLRFTSY